MQFEMIGKISLGKDTDRFHPFEEKTYDSGWVRKVIRFNAQCGDNRHMLTVQAGAFADGHGDVYTFTKSGVDDDGNRIKGEPLKIPFKDRLTSPRIAEVAEFRKFIFDLEKPNRRRNLENAINKIKNGTSLTDEELKNLDLNDESEVEAALEKSKKKRHEFISEWDFVDFIKKVIDSDKYKDSKFLIRGNGEYQYSQANQNVYESYVPNRIYLASDDAVEMSEANITLIYGANAVDEGSVEEKGRYYVSGYSFEYDNNLRKNIPVPMTISIVIPKDGDEKEKNRPNVIKKKFMVDDDTFKELGFSVNMVNGAQRVEIDESMLTDEQREDLSYGLITMDDIRAELGGSVYGERVREYQFKKIAKGYTKGRNETVYTSDDMVIVVDNPEDETDGLFDDDDEI